MAIERDMGAGGINMLPDVLPEEEVMVEELPQDPGIFEFDDGSAIVGEYEESLEPMNIEFNSNLADYIDDADLSTIASDLTGDIGDDFAARQDWEDTYKRGLEYLGMQYEDRTEPFEGSSGVVHPLLAESVTQFQAQAYREMLPASGPIRAEVVGANNEDVIKQAERVKVFSMYKLTNSATL